jgi:thiamine kinase-like enzyme/DNA-binding response OmpR family regulator
MNRHYSILIVEDKESWQDILREASTVPNSRVKVAGNIDAARDLLKNEFFHLAVIDLSLIGEDSNDMKGMTLSYEIFESGLFNATKVIMVSAYGNKQRVREAFRKYEVVDFIPKEDFEPEEFQEQISELLKKDINLGIKIQWADQSHAGQLITNLLIEGKRVGQDKVLQEVLLEELEDLLCRLFSGVEGLLIKPLVSGGSGAAAILITPFYETGAGHPVVVKFGHYSQIEGEDLNYKQYVQQFVGHSRYTNVMNFRRSLRLGGIVYSLVGGASDSIQSFQEFYAESSIYDIREALRKLFHDTCGSWYANKGKLELVDLSEYYRESLGFTWERIEKAIAESLKHVHGNDLFYFDRLQEKRSFLNPVKYMRGKSFPLSTYQCITHGDLNPGNILLDASGQSWLIDFDSTGVGHILRDLAELDVAIRCQLLENEQADLVERLRLEEMLNTPAKFSQIKNLDDNFASENPAVIKAYQAIIELRKIAYDLVRLNPADDIKEYYVALIYSSLNVLRFYGWKAVQREHALMSACLLINKIGAKSNV